MGTITILDNGAGSQELCFNPRTNIHPQVVQVSDLPDLTDFSMTPFTSEQLKLGIVVGKISEIRVLASKDAENEPQLHSNGSSDLWQSMQKRFDLPTPTGGVAYPSPEIVEIPDKDLILLVNGPIEDENFTLVEQVR